MEWVTDKGLIGGIDSLKEKRNHRFFKKKKSLPQTNPSFYFSLLFILCVWVFYTPGILGGQKRALDPMGLELQW